MALGVGVRVARWNRGVGVRVARWICTVGVGVSRDWAAACVGVCSSADPQPSTNSAPNAATMRSLITSLCPPKRGATLSFTLTHLEWIDKECSFSVVV